MRFPMTVLRVVTLAPALLVSFVLTVVVCALLPPALGLVAFLVAAGLLVALALGQFEVPAIATLTRSRPATAAELQVMAPVLAELGGRDVGVDAVFVRRRQGPSTPVAVAIADRAVVVTPGLVAARYRGGVTAAEAAPRWLMPSAGGERSGHGWNSLRSPRRRRGGWWSRRSVAWVEPSPGFRSCGWPGRCAASWG